MGSKLQMQPGRLTLGEIETELYLLGLEEDIILEIGELFRNYELYSYRNEPGDSSEFDHFILSRISRVASELERRTS